MAKRKTKKKPSAFNKRVGSLIKGGKTFRQAVKLASKGGSTRKTARISTKKRKVFKVRVRSSTMAKKRKRSRSSGGFGTKGIAGMLKNAGLAFAIGSGTKALLDTAAVQFNVPQIAQVSSIAGAFTAFSSAKGIPGIAAAAPFLLSLRPINNGGGGSGMGEFV